MLFLLPFVMSAQAWEPVRHGGHAHQIVEVSGMVTAGAGVGLIIAAPVVVAADPQCDMHACGLQMGLGLGLTGIVVTSAGMLTMSVGHVIHCPAIGHDFVLVATPRGVAITTRF